GSQGHHAGSDRRLSLYFVHPPVLRRFLLWPKRVTELGLEEKLKFWPSTLQAAWKMSNDRASALSETYLSEKDR
ncbi:hypothetical protein WG66_014180, partial [Moniliophthora roreri]